MPSPAIVAQLLVVVSCVAGALWTRPRPEGREARPAQDELAADRLAAEIGRALRSLADGAPHEDLPAMDPVRMKDIVFCRGHGPVQATIEFPLSTLAGVAAVEDVSAVRCDAGESSITFTTRHDEIVQDGLYNLTGSFAELFAVGRGTAHIVLRDVRIHHRLQWRRARGELRVRTYRGSVRPRRMKVHYGGSLRAEERGESAQGRQCRREPLDVDVNKYFNANWQLLYAALSPSVDEAFSAVFRDYMDVLLRLVEDDLVACSGHDPV